MSGRPVCRSLCLGIVIEDALRTHSHKRSCYVLPIGTRPQTVWSCSSRTGILVRRLRAVVAQSLPQRTLWHSLVGP